MKTKTKVLKCPKCNDLLEAADGQITFCTECNMIVMDFSEIQTVICTECGHQFETDDILVATCPKCDNIFKMSDSGKKAHSEESNVKAFPIEFKVVKEDSEEYTPVKSSGFSFFGIIKGFGICLITLTGIFFMCCYPYMAIASIAAFLVLKRKV